MDPGVIFTTITFILVIIVFIFSGGTFTISDHRYHGPGYYNPHEYYHPPGLNIRFGSGTNFKKQRIYFKSDGLTESSYEEDPEFFEEVIAKKLNKYQQEYKNEKQLRDEETKYTPDFLLVDSNIYVNEDNPTKINWIEVKSYPYEHNDLWEKFKDQAQKYVDEFGPGIVVFNGIHTKRKLVEGAFIFDIDDI